MTGPTREHCHRRSEGMREMVVVRAERQMVLIVDVIIRFDRKLLVVLARDSPSGVDQSERIRGAQQENRVEFQRDGIKQRSGNLIPGEYRPHDHLLTGVRAARWAGEETGLIGIKYLTGVEIQACRTTRAAKIRCLPGKYRAKVATFNIASLGTWAEPPFTE